MVTFDVSDRQQKNDQAWEDEELIALIIYCWAWFLQRIPNEDKQTNASIKNENFFVFRVITKGNKVNKIVNENSKNKKAADSLPIDIFSFSVKINCVKSGGNQKKDKHCPLWEFVGLMSANFVA